MSIADQSLRNRISIRLQAELPELVKATTANRHPNSNPEDLRRLQQLFEIYHAFAEILKSEANTMERLAVVGEYDLERGQLVEHWFEEWYRGADELRMALNNISINSLQPNMMEFFSDFFYIKNQVDRQRAYKNGTLEFPEVRRIVTQSEPDPSWYDKDEDW